MHIYTFLAKITKRSLKMTLLVFNPFQSTLRLNAFEISNTLTSSKTAHSLSPPAEASLYRRETGEREKESARGTMGRGIRKSEIFPLPIVPRFLFVDYCYFYWDTPREPVRRREVHSLLHKL